MKPTPDPDSIGLKIPSILLPKDHIDMQKWAVIACDQYTAEPEYWEKVNNKVGNSPSTLHLIFPEVYLKEPNKNARIQSINDSMDEYLQKGVWKEHKGLIYVERKINGKIRHGLVVALDLEHYDYSKGSTALIRATEGTIVDRLPPRIKIRKNAPVELPHIMVLIDDPQKTVIEPLEKKDKNCLYDFELMLNGGHIKGFSVPSEIEQEIISNLHNLTNPEKYQAKYNLSSKPDHPLLYAMGDGNHSLATAKAIWEQTKAQKPDHHPSRYALVELVNLHSDALEFEPIHRVLFNLKIDIMQSMKEFFSDALIIKETSQDAMISTVKSAKTQIFGMIFDNKYYTVEIQNPNTNLTVGSLQAWLDTIVEANEVEEIDYIHGLESTIQLSMEKNNVGFYLPVLKKEQLFPTVILDGALPRKTFSMGEAEEKRYYLEARKIQ